MSQTTMAQAELELTSPSGDGIEDGLEFLPGLRSITQTFCSQTYDQDLTLIQGRARV
jgi:hypothetical protein